MLLLTSFSVENFRGIRQGTISGLTDVNVIIGRNNSGKTTLLEAMHRRLSAQFEGVLGYQAAGYWSSIRNESTPEDSRNLLANAHSAGWLSFVRSSEEQLVHTEVDLGRVPLQILHSNQHVRVVPSSSQQAALTCWSRFSQGISCFRPPDSSNRSIEAKLWPQLLGDRSDKRLAAALNDVFALQAESFQLLPSGKLIVLFENHSVPLDAQGDGTRAAMRCLMLLTALKQTLFIMEEPECHQHPGSLEKFALAVCKLAKQNEVQLMISTHSGECVKAFLKAAEAANSEGAVFHLSLTDGVQTARRLDAEAVETLQNTGIDVRFLDLYS